MSETASNSQYPKPKASSTLLPVSFVVMGGIVFLVIGLYGAGMVKHSYDKSMCRGLLKGIGIALRVYSSDYDGEYPTADKWWDLLAQPAIARETKIPSYIWEQRKVDDSQVDCCYALNPYAKPNSPPDIVLVFDTKQGRNMFGGEELLTFENHNGKGCNVLFNDYTMRFIAPEKIGELRWKGEQKQ